MKDYRESGLYKLGRKLGRLSAVLLDENSTLREVVDAFHDSGFGLEFRLVIREEPVFDDELQSTQLKKERKNV